MPTDTEPGHIPGSVNMPFYSFLSKSGHFLPKEKLKALFTQAGVHLSRPVCVLCGSAVTACHVVLAAHECGHPAVSVYDGGWSEWFSRALPEHVISDGRGKHLWLVHTGWNWWLRLVLDEKMRSFIFVFDFFVHPVKRMFLVKFSCRLFKFYQMRTHWN